MAVAEGVAKELSAVQSRVVLSRYVFDDRRFQAAGDLAKETHPIGMLARVFRIVREVSGEKDQVGRMRHCVDSLDRLLERSCAERIRRTGEADVRIGELDEGERSRRFTVLLFQQRGEVASRRRLTQH